MQRINTISRSGEHLLHLKNDILDLSKIEAGKTVLQIEGFSLTAMIKDLESIFTPLARKGGLSFSLYEGSGLPEFILADEKRIRQILINLLGNAVKFTRKGGIVLRVEYSCGDDKGRLTFQVEYSGPGIERMDLKRIFPSVDRSTQGQKIGGTGLDLTISRNPAELMAGELTVESRLGTGSWFTLDIPCQIDSDFMRTGDDYRYRRIVMVESVYLPCRVLVADDVEVNRL